MLSLGPFLIFFPIFFSARLISQQAWFHRPHFSKFSFEEWFCNHGPHPLLAQEDFLIEFFQANKHLHVGSVGLLGFFFLRKLGLRLPFKMTLSSPGTISKAQCSASIWMPFALVFQHFSMHVSNIIICWSYYKNGLFIFHTSGENVTQPHTQKRKYRTFSWVFPLDVSSTVTI